MTVVEVTAVDDRATAAERSMARFRGVIIEAGEGSRVK